MRTVEHRFRPGCGPRAQGGASLFCAPAARKPQSPPTPIRGHQSPVPPETLTRPSQHQPEWAPGSATRGFGGTAGGREAQRTAMADGSEICGEKRLPTPGAPGRARRGSPAGRRARGAALRC